MVRVRCSTPVIPAGQEVQADLVSPQHSVEAPGNTVWVHPTGPKVGRVFVGLLLRAEPEGQ